jgi:hypothetical protein
MWWNHGIGQIRPSKLSNVLILLFKNKKAVFLRFFSMSTLNASSKEHHMCFRLVLLCIASRVVCQLRWNLQMACFR